MRLLMITALLLTACSNKEAEDPCERASANAKRLIGDDEVARGRYGEDPFSVERCRESISASAATCIGYASSVDELEKCSPNALRRIDVARE